MEELNPLLRIAIDGTSSRVKELLEENNLLESRLAEKEKVLKEIDWYLQVAKGREPSSECKVRIEGLVKSALQEGEGGK